MAFQPTTTETTLMTGLASATSEERRALSHALESEPHVPLHARHACKLHGHIVSCSLLSGGLGGATDGAGRKR